MKSVMTKHFQNEERIIKERGGQANENNHVTRVKSSLENARSTSSELIWKKILT